MEYKPRNIRATFTTPESARNSVLLSDSLLLETLLVHTIPATVLAQAAPGLVDLGYDRILLD